MRNSSGIALPTARQAADNLGDLGYAAGFKVSDDETIAIVSGDVGGLHRIQGPFDRMAKGEQLILPGKLATAYPHGMGEQNNGVYDAAITADGTRAATIAGGRLYRLDSLRSAKVADVAWTHLTNFAYNGDLASNNQTNDERRNRRKIAFDPANNNVLLVGAKAKLMYSDDGGANLAAVTHMPVPTAGGGATLMTWIDFDRLSAVTGGKTQRFAVGVSGSGVYVTQDGNPANLTLVYSAALTFFDVFWDTETAGKLWILAGLAHPNVLSWTAAGGVVSETKFPRLIRGLLVRRGTPAHQIAWTDDGKLMHTANDWVSHRFWQQTGSVRGIATRSPIAAGRSGKLIFGWPPYCKADGSEAHFAAGVGHCYTRWADIPAAADTTRANQFPIIEAGYQGINRLIGMNAKWLRDGRVAYLSQDVQLCIGDPEAPFAAISNPSDELGFGYDIDSAIDDPDWHAFSLQGGRSGFFDLPGLPAMTIWTNTPAVVGGGMCVRNKGEVTLVSGTDGWPVQSVNAHTATPTWQDCTFTGYAKPVAGTSLGFGFDIWSVRLIITCNKLTGERWCWNYLNPRWGIWRSPDGSAPFAKVLDGAIPSDAMFGTYSAHLLFAPGTHDLYLRSNGSGSALATPDTQNQTNRIRVSRNASAFAGTLAPFADLGGVCKTMAMAFGAPMPGHTYPMLWAAGWRLGDLALGIHGSPDGGATWPIFWPWPYNTSCHSLAADPVKFGRLIVSVHGFGHQFLDLSARDNRRR